MQSKKKMISIGLVQGQGANAFDVKVQTRGRPFMAKVLLPSQK
jgi:hypothetical protein